MIHDWSTKWLFNMNHVNNKNKTLYVPHYDYINIDADAEHDFTKRIYEEIDIFYKNRLPIFE